jgi:hypothetical protein
MEHANVIMKELLESIVNHLTPVMNLASINGDAVFVYAPEIRITRGETLIELIEASYVTFKDYVEQVRRRNTCECNACRGVTKLDLKFIVHYGEYIIVNTVDSFELVGMDVNLIQKRLLKENMNESNWSGYALFTEKSLENIGIKPEGMYTQSKNYEYIGEIKTYATNLQTRYEELVDARRVFLKPEEADVVISYDFSAPAPIVWEWLNDTHKRSKWVKGTIWKILERPKGRTDKGARNHCTHGRGTVIETILDWRPFDYSTTIIESTNGIYKMTTTTQLVPIPNGTHMNSYAKIELPLPKWISRQLFKLMVNKIIDVKQMYEKMALLIEQEKKYTNIV